jgi:hypothetical protein
MLNISEEMLSVMNKMVISIVSKAVRHCGEKYNFDAEEALRELNVSDIGISVGSSKKVVKSKVVKEKVLVVKSKYPMPFSGTAKEGCCSALRQNHGLYTQCETTVNSDEKYCKKCGPSPQFGTIEQRLAVGLMEFQDSKGKGPTHFTKVMKKLKISQAEVEEEAGKLNIIINPIHFEEESVEKREKGRPKKVKKTVELEDNSTDLFAALVAKANEESSDSEDESEDEKISIAESVIDTVLEKVSVTVENNEKKAEKETLKEAEKQKKEEEKQVLIQKKASEKAEKEALKEAEKQALIQKKEAEKALKEAEKQKKEAEKQALIQKKEAEKALKEAEKLAEKQKKEAVKPAAKSKKETSDSETEKKKSKPADKKVTKVVEEEEEEDVVKRFEFEGVKYLKSKKTGIIYNMEQDVIGKWNEKTGKIDFEEAGSEEEEEEYDE